MWSIKISLATFIRSVLKYGHYATFRVEIHARTDVNPWVVDSYSSANKINCDVNIITFDIRYGIKATLLNTAITSYGHLRPSWINYANEGQSSIVNSFMLYVHDVTAFLFCSCPFDFVKVHDGVDNTSAIIGIYCGQQRNLVLYSSENSLFVVFYTLPRTANTQNRGFKGIFEFSESFVKLGESYATPSRVSIRSRAGRGWFIWNSLPDLINVIRCLITDFN